MIDKQAAKKLVGRMSQLPGWPRDAQGVTELVLALSEAASSIEQAAAVVDAFSQHSDRCPLPVDVRRQCMSAREETRQRVQGCARCFGTGWFTRWRLRTQTRRGDSTYCEWEELTEAQYHALAGKLADNQRAYSGFDPCSCRSVAA